MFIKQSLSLSLTCLELGLVGQSMVRECIKLLFLKTEQLFKVEQHLATDGDAHREEVFGLAMDCKSLSSRLLLQLLTLVNDSWLFQELKASRQLVKIVDDGKGLGRQTDSSNRRRKSTEESARLIQASKQSSLVSRICRKSGSKEPKVLKDNLIFFEDSQFYSLYSFMMFNYLLTELRHDR